MSVQRHDAAPTVAVTLRARFPARLFAALLALTLSACALIPGIPGNRSYSASEQS